MKQYFARYPDHCRFLLVDDPSLCPGWDILDLLTGDFLESCHEVVGVAQAHTAGNGGYTQPASAVWGDRKLVVRKTQFLMGQRSVDIYGEISAKVQVAQEDLRKALSLKEKAEVALAEESKKRAWDQDRADSMQKRQDKAVEVHESLRLSKEKLEKDLVTLKKMLGEKVINDILNPTT